MPADRKKQMDAEDPESLEIIKNPIFEGKDVKVIAFRINILSSLHKYVCDTLQVAYSDFENLKKMIESSSDLAAQNRKLEGAIHLSASAGCFESILVLSEAKVDVNARTKEGKTAFEYAKNEVCTELLKFVGANGWTPLMVAAERGLDQVEIYLEYRNAVLPVLNKTQFTPNFQELVRNTMQAHYFHWSWVSQGASSIKVSEDGLRISTNQKSTAFYSCAIGNRLFEKGIHTWAISVERVQSMWLGVARAAEGQNLNASPKEWTGDYLIAFGSDKAEPVVAGGPQSLEMDGCFSFQSGQIVEFELDMNQRTLKVKVDGILKCMVRNISDRGVSPYICMCRGETSMLLYSSVNNEVVSRNEISESDSHIGFDNTQWTMQMDATLWELSDTGNSHFYVPCTFNEIVPCSELIFFVTLQAICSALIRWN
jgi:hypothetical protein